MLAERSVRVAAQDAPHRAARAGCQQLTALVATRVPTGSLVGEQELQQVLNAHDSWAQPDHATAVRMRRA